jgi:hypothetical protein
MSILCPDGNVLLTTFPEVTLLSFVLTKAGPLPGLTCWNSTILYKSLLKLITNPFLISEVSAI